MTIMFTYSIFNSDISAWDTSKVTTMRNMFANSEFNNNISKWNVSNVKDMSYMFASSKFNGDISNWKINKDCVRFNMFAYCTIKEEYKPKAIR